MDANSKDSRVITCSGLLPALNRHTIYSYYLPLNGCISYYAFSLHCSLPGGLIRVIPNMGSNMGLRVINCLLFNSHLGIGLYLYSSRQMRAQPLYHRIMFSAFGSVIFNFGSILFCATTRALLPDYTWIRVLFSLFTSFGFLTIAKEYIECINKMI